MIRLVALAVAAALVLTVPPATAGDGWFSDSTYYRFGGLGNGEGSQTLASADFDGDGDLDVAVTNFLDGVQVFLGNGDGALAKGQKIGTGLVADGITSGDLNADGAPDLAVTNGLSSTVSVLLNDGAGRFTKSADYGGTGGIAPTGVAIADFDNDGLADLAVNNLVRTEGAIAIYPGIGAGRFGRPHWVGSGTSRSTILTADLNHDGNADLLTADATSPWRVVSLLGDGTGQFTEKVSGSTPAVAEDVKLADVNADGHLDAVTTNAAVASVSVWPGKADGTFGAPVDSPVGVAPCGVAVADFDGDGHADLAVLNYLPANAEIYRGDGSGRFTLVEKHQSGLGGQSAFAVDLQGTGRPDVLTLSSLSLSIGVLTNRRS